VILAGRWNLDWKKINSGRVGTFNAYDFTHQQLVVRDQSEVDDDFLIAGVSLPGWFSPVKIGDAEFIDAVYVTDANLIGAIERGADELWTILNAPESPRWGSRMCSGFVWLSSGLHSCVRSSTVRDGLLDPKPGHIRRRQEDERQKRRDR
jgi:predicted acylesterase/phospholipase RssA